MQGVAFTLSCPYFVSFRKPQTTSVLLTYPVPPYTTIRGLLENAIGAPRDSNIMGPKRVKIGIDILEDGDINTEIASILKLKALSGRVSKGALEKSKKENPSLFSKHKDRYDDEIIAQFKSTIEAFSGIPLQEWRTSLSSPVFRDFLCGPAYRIYLAFNDKGSTESMHLSEICYKSLLNPVRPLYLGQSDDMVAVEDVEQISELEEIQSAAAKGLVPAIVPDSDILRLPFSFDYKRDTLQFQTVSLRRESGQELSESYPAFRSKKEAFYAI